MGTNHYTIVVYGVKETEEMRDARKVMAPRTRRVCSGNPGHSVHRRTAEFCGICGCPTKEHEYHVSSYVDPVEAYAPNGRAPDDEVAHSIIAARLVHQSCPNQGGEYNDVAIGLKLYRAWAGESEAFEVPSPTPEQEQEVHVYLAHLGIHSKPGIVVIVGAS